MPVEDEGRRGKHEDPFDDLDDFFGPAEAGWGDTPEDPSEGAGTAGTGRGAVRIDPSELEPERDILPQGWGEDIEGIAPPAGGGVSSDAPLRPATDPRPVSGERARVPFSEGPSGEVGSGDWSKLRGILGDAGNDEEDFEFDFPSEEPRGPQDTTFGFADLDEGAAGTREGSARSGEGERSRGAVNLGGMGRSTDSDPTAGGEDPDRTAFVEVTREEDVADPRSAADHPAEEAERRPIRTIKVGAGDSMTAPAWEEPASQPVSSETVPSERRSDRNLPAAVVTGAVLLAAALISIALSKAAFAVVAGLVALAAQAELYVTMRRRGYQPATALGLALGALALAGAYLKGEGALLFILALGLVLSFLWYMAGPAKSRSGLLAHAGATMLGLVYVAFFAGFLLVVLSMPWGRAFTLALLGLTFLYDIAAFAIGSFWGNRPLAPTISPRKSWEGLLGATVVTFAVSIALLPSVAPIEPSVAAALGLALVVSVFAPLGDLAESALKRDLGVKDMGTVLPGHGGILDRIDALLFVAPAAYYFLRLVL